MAGRPVVIIGELYDPSLSVGYPLPPAGAGGAPPGIWGPPGPWPSPPIHLPPAQPPGIWPPAGVVTPPIYYPPVISGPPGPWPTPPIHLPPAGGGGAPPGIWPPAGVVSPPIYYPPEIWPQPPAKPPLGIWGGGNVPMPTPPIYIPPAGGGGQPPGIWGPLPGFPTHPIVLPPGTLPDHPEHPIVIPPDPGVPGVPAHPIVLPPPGSPPDQKPEVLENWDVKSYWSPATGWGVAIVPSQEHPGVPTPSKS